MTAVHPPAWSARPLQTIVFDLDGVLIDSFAVMREAFAIAYREVVADGEPPFEEYLRHQGRYFPDIMRLMGLPLAMEAPFVSASHRLVHRVRVYPDVHRLLGQLRAAGVRTAIATGKSVARARTVLDAHGLLPLLDAVVGSDEVPRPKPMPDIVLEALRRLDAGPAGAVMVGDAVTDIRTGRSAGVATIGATWGEGDPTELAGERPDLLLDRPLDLLDLVDLRARGRGPRRTPGPAGRQEPHRARRRSTMSTTTNPGAQPDNWTGDRATAGDAGPRFSVVGPQGAGLELAGQSGPEAWATLTRTAELAQARGFHDLWLLDRTDTLPRREPEPVLEGWTALAALAGRIPRLGLGHLIPAAPLRQAALVAKRAAVLDIISGGRFRLGLSGDPALPEHESIGLAEPAGPGARAAGAAERRRAVGETIAALRELWTGRPTTLAGEWVHLDGAHCVPTPTAARLPVTVRLPAVGDLLDEVVAGVDAVQWTGEPGQLAAAITRFGEQRERLGLDPGAVRHAVALECRIFDSQIDRDRWFATPNLVVFWSHHPDLLARRNLYGTPTQVTERAGRYLDAGVEEFVLWFRDYPNPTSLARFATDVMPALTSRAPAGRTGLGLPLIAV